MYTFVYKGLIYKDLHELIDSHEYYHRYYYGIAREPKMLTHRELYTYWTLFPCTTNLGTKDLSLTHANEILSRCKILV